MDRIIKLNSRQGNFNQSGKNLVDFVIPRDNVYNLKDSYIVVNVSIPTTETNPDSAGVPPQQYSGVEQALDMLLPESLPAQRERPPTQPIHDS